ncbi:aspartyl-phosphate phosphatase Spo0E family protein [Bacillus sp. T3]|uniref:aspartyl-phosphate phosphatase Spo0E family protein n=1 Tax=Bacillus sp. T3 TaxID=467262 RepID=UPI002982201C|nr:aspartyl-phosphate phosphatase Spo0E family protein [Bacillus sp. T3]
MEGLLTVNLCDLQNKIESLKNRMIDTGLKHGLNHGKTIQISQELDALIFEYQHLIRN